ncbi:DUF1385 domain-containing protein [Candidatus Woesearchaeota archaeon]|nr:DUF1385 domain-containing protein [Candidatus Woesearchaeota archaeon]
MPKEKEPLISAGGQAVIEGVMMRSQDRYAIAVRKKDGSIKVRQQTIDSLAKKYPLLQWPFLRGIHALCQMLLIGMRALTYSANEAAEEEDQEIHTWELVFSILLVLVFALFFFKFLPLLVARYFETHFPLVEKSALLFSLIDGLVKILFFFLYLIIISLSKDVQRVFAYHGAEHKAVYCYEHRRALTVKNVRAFRTMHPRCGTSFILYVLLLSIFLYAFLPNHLSFAWKYFWRILLLPVIAGISYEVLKISAKFQHQLFFRILTLPGLALQKITTKEPDHKQMKVAIAALKRVIQ